MQLDRVATAVSIRTDAVATTQKAAGRDAGFPLIDPKMPETGSSETGEEDTPWLMSRFSRTTFLVPEPGGNAPVCGPR
jgi:hypothetical protein